MTKSEGPAQSKSTTNSRPYVVSEEGRHQIKIRRAKNPLPGGTLGDLDLTVTVSGDFSDQVTVVVPYQAQALVGIDARTVRMFRWDTRARTLRPIWNSGINEALEFVWAKVAQPGTMIPLGLPRDRLVCELLRVFATERRLADASDEGAVRDVARRVFGPFLETDDEELFELRALLARIEVQSGSGELAAHEIRYGQGRHQMPFPFPKDVDTRAFKERLASLEIGLNGLPEEVLFTPPDHGPFDEPPWPRPSDADRWSGINPRELIGIRIPLEFLDWFPWFLNQDWWMYHADEEHTGRAKGLSGIRTTSVSNLRLLRKIPVDGPVFTIPSIVDGKVYVGTSKWSGGGGTLYKIDLATGNVDGSFATSGTSFYSISGIGGSPAVTGGRIYITTVYGKVYCVDAATMTQIWVTDLKVANPSKNQPVNNPNGDCWSGPLVVNGRVYVGSGEGESWTPFGFIWCLDASTGNVVWLFCTNKFTSPNAPGNDNAPNAIPSSSAAGWAAGAGFTVLPDPPNRGAAVWSSCGYDRTLNRIYVCTGNSRDAPSPGADTPLPDPGYASGLISLDATSGTFRGFFQPAPTDSYRPTDMDVDIPAAPTVFARGAQRVVAFGSKNGSFILLDADTLAVLARRQMLPTDESGALISTVDPDPWNSAHENMYGIMATAAVQGSTGRIYVGVGGYAGIDDYRVTPFVRAVDWNTLADAWPTAVDNIEVQPGVFNQVRRYSSARPPLYTNPGEAGLASPAIVNDVVFMSTSKVALYALDTATGLCLWARNLPGRFSLGPAIYGDYVVIGSGDSGPSADNAVYIYQLGRPRPWIPPRIPPWWWGRWPWLPTPGPWPDPDPPYLERLIRGAVREELGQAIVAAREQPPVAN